MAECKETVATMLDVQVQTAPVPPPAHAPVLQTAPGGYAAAAKRGEAARPARQAAMGAYRCCHTHIRNTTHTTSTPT